MEKKEGVDRSHPKQYDEGLPVSRRCARPTRHRCGPHLLPPAAWPVGGQGSIDRRVGGEKEKSIHDDGWCSLEITPDPFAFTHAGRS
jgi:hypothetical protein